MRSLGFASRASAPPYASFVGYPLSTDHPPMALARPAAMASQALLIAHWHAGEEHVSVVDHVGDISGLGHYLVSDVIGSEDILRTCQAVLRRSHQRHIRGNVGWFIGPFHPTVPHQLGCLTIRHPPLFVAPVRVDEPPLRNRVLHRATMIQASLKRGPVGIPYRRFAAWPKPPDGRRDCRPRARRTCRSALRPGWRRPSFWRVILQSVGDARSPSTRPPDDRVEAVILCVRFRGSGGLG